MGCQLTIDQPCVPDARPPAIFTLQPRAGGIVGTYAIPGDAIEFEAISKQPRADVDVDAGIKKIGFMNAIPCQHRQVRTIDLHDADVVGTASLEMGMVDCARIQIGFDARNRHE